MRNEVKVLEGVEGDGKSPIAGDESWIPCGFVHEPPVLNVTQPKGSFCQIDARFSVPLRSDQVYDIITDPNNRRVFKNIKVVPWTSLDQKSVPPPTKIIKGPGTNTMAYRLSNLAQSSVLGRSTLLQEVVYRKVLQDDGNRQLVEVEQLGRWHFLMFSGTFSSRVLVEQNRQQHTMLFDLARKGMMKKFSGSWKIEPIFATGEDAAADCKHKETGSWVTFNQTVEPAIIPPWPLNGYVRRVTAKIICEICGDLQRECIRLAEVKTATIAGDKEANS